MCYFTLADALLDYLLQIYPAHRLHQLEAICGVMLCGYAAEEFEFILRERANKGYKTEEMEVRNGNHSIT